FPPAEQVIPARTAGATTGRLAAEDAAFLAQALPRLPGGRDADQAVTVDLNGHVAVRAREEGQGQVTEVRLSHSEVAGPPVRFATNRGYLARALRLGLAELVVLKPDTPVFCRDATRTYLWMPLGKDGALPPSDGAVRIASDGTPAPPTAPPLRDSSEHATSTPTPTV